MGEHWVVNASPIIVLARVNQVRLMPQLCEEVIMPEEVADEIRAGPTDDPARQIIEAGLIRIVTTPFKPPELLAWDLGPGETAVLAHAMLAAGWVAVLDDAAARRCAQSFSIPLIGTLAIIVRAKQAALIDSAAEVMAAIQSNGFRIQAELVRSVLRETVQEDWPVSEE